MRKASNPRTLQEVRRRARRLQESRGWGYGKAMRTAGWMVAKAKNRRRPNKA